VAPLIHFYFAGANVSIYIGIIFLISKKEIFIIFFYYLNYTLYIAHYKSGKKLDKLKKMFYDIQ